MGSVILWLLANVTLLDFAIGGVLLFMLPEAMGRGVDIVLEPLVRLQVAMLDGIYGHPFMGIHSSGRILQFIAIQAALIGGVVFAVTCCIGACLNRFRNGAKQ